MDTTNVNEAQRLQNLKEKLARLDARLNSLPIVSVKLYDISGNEIDTSAAPLQKDSSAAAPTDYQTLAADLIADYRTLLQTQMGDIDTEIAALSC